MLISYFSFVLLSLAVSADVFAAGLSYGMRKVKVPFGSVCTLSFISGLMFALSLKAGKKIAAFIPPKAAAIFSFLVLLILALYKLYDALPDKYHFTKNLTTDSLSARVNRKEPAHLSCIEAALLSLILSLDSLTAGIGAGAATPPLPFAAFFLLSFFIHFLFFRLGLGAGKRLFFKGSRGVSFFPAALLFFLAVSRLF